MTPNDSTEPRARQDLEESGGGSGTAGPCWFGGVPLFILDGKALISGAQPAATILAALQRVATDENQAAD